MLEQEREATTLLAIVSLYNKTPHTTPMASCRSATRVDMRALCALVQLPWRSMTIKDRSLLRLVAAASSHSLSDRKASVRMAKLLLRATVARDNKSV